jgi:hypothetical protein
LDNGGSAFPSEQHECLDGSWNQTYDCGMSLRDWFAGQALMGLVAGMGENERADTLDEVLGGKRISKAAFMYADAMILARKSGQPS